MLALLHAHAHGLPCSSSSLCLLPGRQCLNQTLSAADELRAHVFCQTPCVPKTAHCTSMCWSVSVMQAGAEKDDREGNMSAIALILKELFTICPQLCGPRS